MLLKIMLSSNIVLESLSNSSVSVPWGKAPLQLPGWEVRGRWALWKSWRTAPEVGFHLTSGGGGGGRKHKPSQGRWAAGARRYGNWLY